MHDLDEWYVREAPVEPLHLAPQSLDLAVELRPLPALVKHRRR
jgi:hypothetical protein